MNALKSFQRNKFNLSTGFCILLERLRVLDATSEVLAAWASLAVDEISIATVLSFPNVGDTFEL